MAKIFISYRRNDSGYVVDALHRALSRHVDDPKRDIFLDVDNIPFGVNFVDHLNRKVGECEVFLAVIGKDWLNASDPVSGERLISRQDDFVRVEIAAALERGVPVIPVLLDGAQVPNPSELPESIRSLSHHNGVRLTRENFNADIEKLVRGSPIALSRKDASASVQSSSVSVEDEGTAAYTAYVSSSETGRPKLDGSVDQEFYFRRSPLLWFALPVYIIIFPLLPFFLTMMAKSQFWMSKRGFETKFDGELRAIPWSAIESIEQKSAVPSKLILRVSDVERFGWSQEFGARCINVKREQVIVHINDMTSKMETIAQTAIRYHQLYR